MQANRNESHWFDYRVAAATRALAPWLALLAAVAVPLAGAHAACFPIELLYDENEDVHEKHVDHNKDCKFDEFVYYAGGKPERAEKDTDLNGAIARVLANTRLGNQPEWVRLACNG